MLAKTTVRTLLALTALSLLTAGCDATAIDLPGNHAYGDGGSIGAPPWSGGGGAADAGVGAPNSQQPGQDGEKYGDWVENDWVRTSTEPKSTFGIDVDTASYTLGRSDLTKYNRLPAKQSVRVEEYLNYFDYHYADIKPGSDAPFSVSMELAPSKFGKGRHLLRVALKGREILPSERRAANLVFLVDVSGSMGSSDKLPLVKKALAKLVDSLDENDTLGIVVYASNERIVLNPTSVRDKGVILDAINKLSAGGATHGSAGIKMAYRLAEQAFKQGGINRVLLCTDGDMNVGLTGQALVDLVVSYRKKGVTLTTLGFGRGNYNDKLMQKLANDGNGNYYYIDGEAEAYRVLVKKLVATLQVIAKDVKIQLELDSQTVARYRLLGYESRLLQNKDFTDDKKDAGEIGAGHRVTAFYEIELATDRRIAGKVATLRLRYKAPDGDISREISRTIALSQAHATFAHASDDFRFAAAVAELAEILRHSKHSTGARFSDVIATAQGAAGNDSERLAFVDLARKASSLWVGQQQ